MHNMTRRAALMGAAGLLSACQATDDLANSIFGDSKPPLPGQRRPVLSTDRPLEVDAGPRVAVTLPPPVARTDWPQVGGGLGHAPGNPALGSPLAEVWRASVGASST